MAHLPKDKEKLLIRVRRIRGLVDAIEGPLESEQACDGDLQLMAACRSELNSLRTEGHGRARRISRRLSRQRPKLSTGTSRRESIDIVQGHSM